MEVSYAELNRLIREDEKGRIFAAIVLEALDDGAGFACMDAAIVKAALKAIYPEMYTEEMQSRHAVKTPLYEIKAEGEG